MHEETSTSTAAPTAAGKAAEGWQARNLNCPRCGYDVRGEPATWKDSCPIEGVCTECGLPFEWASIFFPDRDEPPWCIEHVPKRSIPRGGAGTFLRSFLPWRFWSRLRLSHVIRPGRLLLYVVAIGIAPLLISYVAVQTTAAVMVRTQIADGLSQAYARAVGSLPLYEQAWEDWERFRDREEAIAANAMPEFGIDPSRSIEEQLATQEEWERVWQLTTDYYEATIEWMRELGAAEPMIHMPVALAVAEAVLFPMSETSRGRIEVGGQEDTYIAPAQLHDMVAQLLWMRNPAPGMFGVRLDTSALVRNLMLVLGLVTLYLLLFPVTFILLPITRRRAKVRWSHFGRITAYSLFIPSTLYMLHALIVAIQLSVANPSRSMIDGQLFGLALLSLAMAMLWWYFAIRIHLRLPHAFWLLAVLSFLVILAISIAVGYGQLIAVEIAGWFIR